MISDRELIESYAGSPKAAESEAAFRELVRRHIDLVYAAAWRSLQGNATLAGDVTQAVFTTLAREAKRTAVIQHLPAWLYATTRFTVSHAVRTERRRQEREQKAYAMQTLLGDAASSHDPEIPAGLIDDALDALKDDEREAVLLRYFENASFAAIGAALEVTEDAARMRVSRAIDRLRDQFAAKGIRSSATAIGAALAGQAMAAPAGLASMVATGALGTAAVAAVGVAGSHAVLATFMSTKVVSIAASAAVLLSLGYGGFQYREAHLRAEEARRATQAGEQLSARLQEADRRLAEAEQRAAFAANQATEARHSQEPSPRPSPAPVLSPQETERRAGLAAKLAKTKPLLEAGQPIRGAVVVLLNAKPSEQPVALVIGRETTVTSDEGLYRIQPTLTKEGYVRYGLTLVRKDPEGGADMIVSQPAVIQTPWEGFGIRTDGKAIIEFDSDEKEPR